MSEPEIRKIIHVDMDAFYASVEQRDDPALRGKPVAVGGRAARRRLAASATRRASSACARPCRRPRPSGSVPELVFVKPRFDVYKDVSRQIREIFLRVHAARRTAVARRGLPRRHRRTSRTCRWRRDIAREIRARILEQTGLTASAGISYNKFLAKLASDHRKPNGQSVIPPEKGPAFVEEPAGRQVPRRRAGRRRRR